jgi:hypothetical protein
VTSMEVVYGVGGVQVTPGERLTVVLVDGVGTECAYTLIDVASPPPELKIARPPHVPVLDGLSPHRDPGFIYFRLRMYPEPLHRPTPGVDTQGRPFYDQILRD